MQLHRFRFALHSEDSTLRAALFAFACFSPGIALDTSEGSKVQAKAARVFKVRRESDSGYHTRASGDRKMVPSPQRHELVAGGHLMSITFNNMSRVRQ